VTSGRGPSPAFTPKVGAEWPAGRLAVNSSMVVAGALVRALDDPWHELSVVGGHPEWGSVQRRPSSWNARFTGRWQFSWSSAQQQGRDS
jgi:hypothetical protein